jgi:hypothetical protein
VSAARSVSAISSSSASVSTARSDASMCLPP